ncbi:MAG: type II toxin-antitoxin system MqsA family antitoxin [Campylobacterota bacterium]|nr:type II toxin-antitoxin system MqsA family antitoxin [Campylobacterota bacterium]
MTNKHNKCPVCNGYKSISDTTFTVDLGFGVVVVRHVPAEVCEQCGSEWIADNTSEQLENIVNDARAKHSMIEVAEYSNLTNPALAS